MKKSGFTLIELLVVITIISILSVIGMAVYSGVQKNARDARRKSDIDAISKALEVNYGNTACSPAASGSVPYCSVASANAAILFSNSTIPSDPKGGTYFYTPSGLTSDPQATFTICGLLETATGNYNAAADNVTCPGSTNSTNTGLCYCRSNQQ